METGNMKEANLENIADGVASELFTDELKKISKNMLDPNTAAKDKRTLTLTFEFAPDDERNEVKVLVTAKSKLAATKGYSKTVFTGKRNGEPTIFGQDTRQMDLFDTEVTGIGKAKQNA